MDKLNKKLQESLRSEVTVLRHTKHHNIVCLLDLIQDNNRLFIVLEFCAGGDLGHYIKRYRQVSEATARYFLQQLAEGLKELRRHNVIHRDLKPQNLLLSDSSSTPLLKIADFGFARSLAPQGLAETLCGSPLYMAPEILQFHKYDAKADLWSIGTILYELLVGKPPFTGANHMQLLRNIERGEARLPEAVGARLSPACRGLLGRLLQRNPVERLSFEEFFTHPFLSGSTAPSAGADLEQLMGGAVELLRLAKVAGGLSSSAAAGEDGCWGPSGLCNEASQFAGNNTGGDRDMAGGLGRIAGSLMALPLPDPFVVLYRRALDSCRAAAVEEVMGNWQSSMAGYSLAADLLLFLGCEWRQLGRANPALQQQERAALQRLYAAVNARLAAVVAEAPSAVVN
ncbi:hypothetical protein OEZ85_008186 [Tetradesmus obliquus]|uniref:Protein kinase domain-containing protein n=1 Tax=Tetradesmus obliquus TaxID=3088 RepID=A0ABY8TMR8_TETOB|nr:hypothetical protein OEZ85_008186 [Tetradesmus obliquus]